MNTRSKHEHLKGILSLSCNPGFVGISVKFPIYHYDSMARGGPSVHFLEAPGTRVPPEVTSPALLALHYSFLTGEEDQYVDTILGKGDTLYR